MSAPTEVTDSSTTPLPCYKARLVETEARLFMVVPRCFMSVFVVETLSFWQNFYDVFSFAVNCLLFYSVFDGALEEVGM